MFQFICKHKSIMPFFYKVLLVFILLCFCCAIYLYAQSEKTSKNTITWHSKLMPFIDGRYKPQSHKGFKLPDFSYAGYFKGEKEIPKVRTVCSIGPMSSDNTSHIQSALDKSKGGAVLLKKGTYIISDEIHIPPNTVLRGEGSDKTFIVVNNHHTKRFSAIVGNRSRKGENKINFWRKQEGEVFQIINDVDEDTAIVRVKSTIGLKSGDYIVIKNSVTNAFRKEYNGQPKVKNKKIWPGDLSSLKFLRSVKSISKNSIILDQPIPASLKLRDKPYVLKISDMGENIGLERLSIGFITDSLDNRYNRLRSNGAESSFHAVDLVCFGNVSNGWIFDVKSFSPNNNGYHVLSRGIEILNSSHITIKDCDIGYPLNVGNGGNGYGLIISMSSDCLISNCKITKFRHNYLFHFPSSGNVITGCQSNFSLYPSDFHHSLANTNLIENMEFNCLPRINHRQAFVLKNRREGSMGAGITGMKNVFWRVKISPKTFSLQSEQAGQGYIIGATAVEGNSLTHGTEWREGIGQEEGLRPVSLYRAQLANRLRNKGN